MNKQMRLFTGKKLALTVLLMVFGFGLFAGPKGKNPKHVQKKKGITRTLSADELALYDTMEKFYQENYTAVVDQTVTAEVITKVVVYDLAGNLLQEQGADLKKIDLRKLPQGAKLLMKEGSIHYYIVM